MSHVLGILTCLLSLSLAVSGMVHWNPFSGLVLRGLERPLT